MKNILILLLICSLGGCVSSSGLDTFPFPESVFGSKAVFEATQLSDSPTLYQLSGENEQQYLSNDRTGRLLRYPIVGNHIPYTNDSMRELLAIIHSEQSYMFGAILGVGPSHWDAMLSFRDGQERIDILLWVRPHFIRVLKNQIPIGQGFLGKQPFGEALMKMLPREK